MGVIRQEGTGPHPDAPSLRPSGSWGPTDKAMMPPEYLERMSMPTTPMTENEIADVIAAYGLSAANAQAAGRSDEPTSDLQSLMRISYAVFCLNKQQLTTPHIEKKIT